MIKHILKIIWAQRRTNGWIFLELMIVTCVLWMMADNLYGDLRTYFTPLGYDITNTWRFNLSELNEKAPDYVAPEDYTSDQTNDLLTLMSNIRQNPAVEEVCMAYFSSPYSYGNRWWGIVPMDGDTTIAKQRSFQMRTVSIEYFDLFRVKDKQGNPVSAQLKDIHNPIVITADMEDLFYHGESAKGRKVNLYGSDEAITIAAVAEPVRANDYSKADPGFYNVLMGSSLVKTVNEFGSASRAELCVRMKQRYTQDDMNRLLEEMGDRLTVNNLYVYGARSIESFRDDQLRNHRSEQKKQFALMAFLLINVFFGIVGTFWLRTQYRQAELGLRVAVGASRLSLKKYLITEGMLLLLLTVPVLAFVVLNMAYFDLLDSRITASFTSFLITIGGTYLLMAIIITLGIWFPIRKIEKLAPAEALHYE